MVAKERRSSGVLSQKINKPFVWRYEQQGDFEDLKSAMTSPPILQFPDWNRDFYLEIHRVSEKTVQISFCHNFVKFPPILIICSKKDGKEVKLCEVYSIFISIHMHPPQQTANWSFSSHPLILIEWWWLPNLSILRNSTHSKNILVECANLRDIREKYFTVSSLADLFNRVDNHT